MKPLFIEVHEFVHTGDVTNDIRKNKPICINFNTVQSVKPCIEDGIVYSNIHFTDNTSRDVIEKYDTIKYYMGFTMRGDK